MNWLQGIEEREKKATEGPWDREEVENFLLAAVYRYQKEFHQSWMRNGTIPTASFIAHARTDIPDLLKFIAEALPVIKKVAGYQCDERKLWAYRQININSHRPAICGKCPPCLARAWIEKHRKESL